MALCADEGEDAEFQCSLLMIIQYWLMIFSRMRSKGSRFALGVWNLRVCSLDVVQPFATVRNRSQPSATVRKCSREVAMAVPMANFAKVVVTFGGFKRCVASFRVAWHFVTFQHVS